MTYKYFKKVDTCICPRCQVTQTIFLYYFNAEGEKVSAPEDDRWPLNVSVGFICVKCNVPIFGDEFYKTAGLTIGDVKP